MDRSRQFQALSVNIKTLGNTEKHGETPKSARSGIRQHAGSRFGRFSALSGAVRQAPETAWSCPLAGLSRLMPFR
eukprot:12274975-Alexandrium_andersonii.AAC.1